MPLVTTMSAQRITRGRYAPSPTGELHLGNLRTALLAWLFARSQQGNFVLRIEDLDRPRVRSGATTRILEDLRWLGLDWDEGPDISGPYPPYTQSERTEIYQSQLKRLQEKELIYPCYCSRAEIARAASAPQGHDAAEQRYPGTCRSLTKEQQRHYANSGHRPSLRLRVPAQRVINFKDLIAGEQQQVVQNSSGDFVIQRADGIFAYQFAVVVDDGLMHINQVVRGADLLGSTARQILLFETLGFSVPEFAHVPLLLDEQGERMSKRIQSQGLLPLQQAGQTPQDVIGHMAYNCGLLTEHLPISASELASACQAGFTYLPGLQASPHHYLSKDDPNLTPGTETETT